jgi:hypothetical protein
MPALKLMKILLIFLIASFLNACAEQATRPENLTSTCVFPNKQVAPGWVCGQLDNVIKAGTDKYCNR